MNYPDQMLYKKKIIRESLSKYTRYDLRKTNFKPVREADHTEHYRQYAALPITFFNGKIKVGIYQRESKYLTLMDHCLMQDIVVNRVIEKIEKILNDYKCHDYNDKTKLGLRFLMVRKFDEDVQVIIVTGQDGIKKEVSTEISRLPEVKSLYYTINTSKHQDFSLQGYKRIYGANAMSYTIGERRYRIGVKGEVFMNPESESVKRAMMKSLINPEDNVLSLNCGNGILEMELPNSITAIDENKDYINDAKENVERLNIENKKFICGKIDKEVISQCKNHQFDSIIIRSDKALSDATIESIYLGKIKHVYLISDHISALAKSLDADLLYNNYYIKTIRALDKDPYSARAEMILEMIGK